VNPLRLFRRRGSARGATHPQAHMTWASTSMGRSVTRTGILLKKNLWVWPVIAVVILSIIGVFVRSAIESTMKENLRSQLQVLLTAETAMLEKWFLVQCSHAETAANDIPVRETIFKLLRAEEEADPTDPALPDTAIRQDLEKALESIMTSQKFAGFFVTDIKAHCSFVTRRTNRPTRRFSVQSISESRVGWQDHRFDAIPECRDDDKRIRTGAHWRAHNVCVHTSTGRAKSGDRRAGVTIAPRA